jgi:type IV pilus biogenesis protein CpaD/CtpE
MRRHPIRLVLAALAISALAACAEIPTGPKAPSGTRFDATTDSLQAVPSSSNQGSQV